ncbi:MAG: PepSY-associated TM helix domain-containing protein [Pseudohongiellaceae bacterium]
MAINRNLVNWSRTIHVYLSIALLIVLVFFSITGITLNHAELMVAEPQTEVRMLDNLPVLPLDDNGMIFDSPELAAYVRDEFGIRLEFADLTIAEPFVTIEYDGPGYQALVEIDQELGEIYAESTDYGLVAVLNDLHKGRYTHIVWNALIDISGIILVIFSLAGFVLLLPNKFRFRKVLKYSVVGIVISVAAYFIATL